MPRVRSVTEVPDPKLVTTADKKDISRETALEVEEAAVAAGTVAEVAMVMTETEAMEGMTEIEGIIGIADVLHLDVAAVVLLAVTTAIVPRLVVHPFSLSRARALSLS